MRLYNLNVKTTLEGPDHLLIRNPNTDINYEKLSEHKTFYDHTCHKIGLLGFSILFDN
jgi:hypothetical protein